MAKERVSEVGKEVARHCLKGTNRLFRNQMLVIERFAFDFVGVVSPKLSQATEIFRSYMELH